MNLKGVYMLHSINLLFLLIVPFHLALKRVMETEGMELEIIINPKATDDGQQVIQVRYGSISFAPKGNSGLIQSTTFYTSTARNRSWCSYQAFQERTWN